MTDYKLVPVEPTAEIVSAMMTSRAVDAEGAFPLLMDLIDYSGENKTRTVVRAAYAAMLAAAPSPAWIKVSERLPTREDADLYCDVWVMRTSWGVTRAKWQIVKEDEDITHWMPKPREQPPSPPE